MHNGNVLWFTCKTVHGCIEINGLSVSARVKLFTYFCYNHKYCTYWTFLFRAVSWHNCEEFVQLSMDIFYCSRTLVDIWRGFFFGKKTTICQRDWLFCFWGINQQDAACPPNLLHRGAAKEALTKQKTETWNDVQRAFLLKAFLHQAVPPPPSLPHCSSCASTSRPPHSPSCERTFQVIYWIDYKSFWTE